VVTEDDQGFDDWATWFAEQQQWQEQQQEDRTFHPGCLLVIGVCVLLWLLVVVGAVTLYPR
jgi:hypothetical protein